MVILPQISDQHTDVPGVTLPSILDPHLTNPFSSLSLSFALTDTLLTTHLPITPSHNMDIPLQKYFLSPLNRNIDYSGMYSHPTLLHTSHSLESEPRNQNELLSILGVKIQAT